MPEISNNPPAAPTPTSSAPAAPSSKKIVFVIEDDAFLVKAYQAKLEKEGYEVWIATDGSEAISYLAKPSPNIVLLDLMLPGASGFDILTQIRKTDAWKNVPVIILTNLGQPQDVQQGKELGAVDYMIKANTKINEIMERVKQHII